MTTPSMKATDEQLRQAQAQYDAAGRKLFSAEPGEKLSGDLSTLGPDLLGEFALAQRERLPMEERWLEDLRQYKGQYSSAEEAQMQGSKQFLRKTRVKVESVDARLTDLLFPANRERNYEIDATPDPSIPREKRIEIIKLLAQANGGQKPEAKAIKKAINEHVKDAAKKMSNRIDDQLTEAKYKDIARRVLHSGNLYGTGILKGPLVERRLRGSYVWDGKDFRHVTKSFAAPFISAPSLWRIYLDQSVTERDDMRYVWEHHRLSRAKMAEIAGRKTFNGEAIRAHVLAQPDGYVKLMAYEEGLRGMSAGDGQTATNLTKTGQYDVYERWGWLTGDQLVAAGVKVPQNRQHEAFFSNVWMLPDGEIIKAVLAPIDGVLWPYHLYYYDKDETSIYGEGLSSIMREDQRAVNAAGRMILDNAAICAGPQFEVDTRAISPKAALTEIHPMKIWPKVGGDFQYPGVRALQFDSHLAELTAVLKLFDDNADETTAIPKFTYGDNPRGGAAETSSGLSMLMGQANIAIKDQVANFDELTKAFIRSLYHWNMKYSRDPSIKGDYDVRARGASSMVAKEVRANALSQFTATLQPEMRVRIKWGTMTEQLAEVMDLSDVVMTEEEFKEEQNSPAAKAQEKLAEMAQQLQLAEMEAKVAKMSAEAARIQAQTLSEKVEAMFAALQGAGVAVQNAAIAPAADQILRDAGWQDANPDDGSLGDIEENPEAALPQNTVQPDDPNTGQRAGIETMEVE